VTTTAVVVGGVGGKTIDMGICTICNAQRQRNDDNNIINNHNINSNNQMQEPCTVPFVDMSHESLCSHHKQLSHHPSEQQQHHLSRMGLGSLGIAMALAFASGSFTTSPCYSSCCDCMDEGTTDWLLLGSLAYQCYFFWSAARHGLGTELP
jgi:hypothetical protein